MLEIGRPELASSYEYLQIQIDQCSNEFAEQYPVELLQILTALEHVESRLASLPAELSEGKKGGIVGVGFRDKNASGPLILRIGKIETPDPVYGEKEVKYTHYALSKLLVLGIHPEFKASRENASLPPEGQCLIDGNPVSLGGIALESGWVVSFSCYKNGGMDECVAGAVAYRAGLAPIEELDGLFELIDNPLWKEVKSLLI